MRCYQRNYPRPQFVRAEDTWKNLNGAWRFAFDDADTGLSRGWFRGLPESREIQVPFTYEYPASGITLPVHKDGVIRHDIVWYERQITIEKKPGRRIFLHFEGSDYHTCVWVNGGFAGEHSGAMERFSFDITHLAKNGENRVSVRVKDTFDISQPRGKQRWQDTNFGCWYVQNTGIWKTVWLEYTPTSRIESVKMTPFLSDKKLEVEAQLCLAPAAGELVLETEVSFNGAVINTISVPAVREKTQGDMHKRLRFSIDVNSTSYEWGVHSWSPDTPSLYDIRFRLLAKNACLDEALSYFGMREIRIEGASVLLNGQILYQRLILDQGYWKDSGLTPPDEDALITDIDLVKQAGYNGVRKHQKVEDERFLYWADVKGLLVWSEMAAAYEFSDTAVRAFTDEWTEIVKQNYNHPSIITWTPFNESWGVNAIMTDAAQQQFTEAIYHLTKALDPYRPVISNDGWEHTVSDIITLHDYEELESGFAERYGKRMEEILANKISHNKYRFAFAKGYGYRGQPVIISEYGGIAFNNKGEGWGYGNKVASAGDYLQRFASVTGAIKKIDAICGFCYTQVTDVQQEVNGILDMERNWKINPESLREINTRA
ncbi:MAG: glycoside hydrolase family 2 [Treponema sp.]|nr:glycoside hydrolase family 2 [Treponema sp.]